MCYYDEFACYDVDIDTCGNLCAGASNCEVAQYSDNQCVLYDGCDCAFQRRARVVRSENRLVKGSSVSGLLLYNKQAGVWSK